MQDAYLRAWRFRDSLSAVPSIRPWLYRVVVNSCYSKLRREIPHRDRRAGDEPLAHVPTPSADPETRAEQGEVAETVLAALQRLPLSLRVPVVLRYYADLSERDIALAIGRRPGTVKSRLHEARRRLAADPALCALAGRRRDATLRDRGDRTMTMLDDDRLASLFARAGGDLRRPRVGRRRHLGPGGRTLPPTADRRRGEASRRRTARRPTTAVDGRPRRPARDRAAVRPPAPALAGRHRVALGGRLPRRRARAGRGGRRARRAARPAPTGTAALAKVTRARPGVRTRVDDDDDARLPTNGARQDQQALPTAPLRRRRHARPAASSATRPRAPHRRRRRPCRRAPSASPPRSSRPARWS